MKYVCAYVVAQAMAAGGVRPWCPTAWPPALDRVLQTVVPHNFVRATANYDYPKVHVKGVNAIVKAGTCAWCHDSSALIAYAFDRAIQYNCTPPMAGLFMNREAAQPLLEFFRKSTAKVVQYNTMLDTRGGIEGSIQYMVPLDSYSSVPGRWCLYPQNCSASAACPFKPEDIANVVLYDYFIGNNDRPGNCFEHRNAPLLLDQGSAKFFKLVPSYTGDPVKLVAMQELIDNNKRDAHVCKSLKRSWARINVSDTIAATWAILRSVASPQTFAHQVALSLQKQQRAEWVLTRRLTALIRYAKKNCGTQ